MTIIEIPKTGSSFSVEAPSAGCSRALIFLPGISGEALSERFKPLVDAGNDAGFAVVRISAWNGSEDVAQKSLGTIHGDIVSAIGYLREHGYASVYAVGKSFGGTLLLTLPPEVRNMLQAQVLWSPVIGIDESVSNVDRYITEPLSELGSLKNLLVDRSYLKGVAVPTLIVHGDADENVEMSNSVAIASMMPDARVHPVVGAGHSFSDHRHEEELVRVTVDYLSGRASS